MDAKFAEGDKVYLMSLEELMEKYQKSDLELEVEFDLIWAMHDTLGRTVTISGCVEPETESDVEDCYKKYYTYEILEDSRFYYVEPLFSEMRKEA